MAKSRSHSSIEKLGVQDLVGHLLEIPGTTYEQIVAQVKKATGTTISKSALSRYQAAWNEKRYRAETIQKEVDAMMAILKQNPEVDPTDGLMLLIKHKLVSLFSQAEANFDQADTLEAAQLLNRIKRTEQMGAALKVQEQRLELLQRRVATTAKEVSETVKGAGLSREVVEAIRQKILGVVPA
jgi:hypothetical protein